MGNVNAQRTSREAPTLFPCYTSLFNYGNGAKKCSYLYGCARNKWFKSAESSENGWELYVVDMKAFFGARLDGVNMKAIAISSPTCGTCIYDNLYRELKGSKGPPHEEIDCCVRPQ